MSLPQPGRPLTVWRQKWGVGLSDQETWGWVISGWVGCSQREPGRGYLKGRESWAPGRGRPLWPAWRRTGRSDCLAERVLCSCLCRRQLRASWSHPGVGQAPWGLHDRDEEAEAQRGWEKLDPAPRGDVLDPAHCWTPPRTLESDARCPRALSYTRHSTILALLIVQPSVLDEETESQRWRPLTAKAPPWPSVQVPRPPLSMQLTWGPVPPRGSSSLHAPHAHSGRSPCSRSRNRSYPSAASKQTPRSIYFTSLPI